MISEVSLKFSHRVIPSLVGFIRMCKIDIPFQVTNLDTGVEQREVKQLVTSLFNECVAVTSVQVYRMEGGSLGVIVKVSVF